MIDKSNQWITVDFRVDLPHPSAVSTDCIYLIFEACLAFYCLRERVRHFVCLAAVSGSRLGLTLSRPYKKDIMEL